MGDFYRKVCKRTKSGNKFSFQYLKCLERINFHDIEYLGQETCYQITRAPSAKPSDKYEYLQLDEQFPVSADHLYNVGFCTFYQILGLQNDNLRVESKIAVHCRIQICAMRYPFIVYFFEDINSINSITINGDIFFIEDTLLQVYDLKNKKQLKSFRISGRNYIKSCKADDQHFVLEISNHSIDRVQSHKFQGSLWIWETKHIFDCFKVSQKDMEEARRIINFEICRHNSDYNVFFTEDVYDVESEIMIQDYKGIPASKMKSNLNESKMKQKEENKVTKSISYFELGSLTRNSLSAYVTSNGCIPQKHELMLFDFSY